MSVTIIIPVHNAAAWLAHAIDSALAQTGIAPVVVVVDDHSTDESAAIAESYGERITFCRTTRRGGNVARNLGLAVARSEWVQFLDADDYLNPDKISEQLADPAVALADVIYSPVIVETWTAGRSVSRTRTLIDAESDRFSQWLTWQLPQTGGALWRRQSLLNLGGWKEDQPCCQEHELYLRALEAELTFQYCPASGAVYRNWSEDTVCRKDPVQVIRERTLLIDRALRWLAQHERLTTAHRQLAGRAGFEMARTWARHDRAKAAAYFATRRALGLLDVGGPAGPWSYRAVLTLVGFKGAEWLAAWRHSEALS